ncbi:uncharacterized protein LOC126742420 [Anthonomus grandis grandis]|uniref:uncharacterized protein LOC126742420 n=1 Tax=Anthonomus grandis grandis TaxID=2921223 RepID=UPI0021664376|nr:uncharacterized protein LOC126742420 [Anthonomus grandis grandis]
MGRRRSKSSSSSSSSSSDDYDYKRNTCKKDNRRIKTQTKSKRLIPPPRENSTQIIRVVSSPSEASTSNADSRIERLEALVEKLIESNSNRNMPSSSRTMARAECIPEYSPGNPNLSCAEWIEKIEQLALANQWDDHVIIFNMQSRLTGLARKCYDNLSSYAYTWDEWKTLLNKSFPEHRDFGSLLERLVLRIKISLESWEQYYFAKMHLLNACEIPGKKAVSCIIHGISDPTIQAGARAGRYNNPEELYAEYLSSLATEVIKSKDLDSQKYDSRGSKRFHKGSEFPVKKFKGPQIQSQFKPVAKCYNCKGKGHFANSCTKPKIECEICKRLGHLAEDYRRKL